MKSSILNLFDAVHDSLETVHDQAPYVHVHGPDARRYDAEGTFPASGDTVWQVTRQGR